MLHSVQDLDSLKCPILDHTSDLQQCYWDTVKLTAGYVKGTFFHQFSRVIQCTLL